MTQKRVNKGIQEIKSMMAKEADFLGPLVRTVVQEFLEAEMWRPLEPRRESDLKDA